MATTKVFNKRQQDIQQAVHSERVSMPRSNEYAEVKQRVKSAGLLEPRPGFYVGMMALNGVLLVATIVMACVVRHPVLVTLNAVMAAFVSGQLAFIMHDAGHHQVGRTNLANTVIGVVHGNLLLGVDFVWWKNKHAEHHANPNHLDADPEIDVPILAYTEEQARGSVGLARAIMRYQAWFFFPLMALATPMWHITGVQYLWSDRSNKHRAWRWAMLAAHAGLYVTLTVWAFGPWLALWWIVVHQAFLGIYLASSFAPNHKGMLLIAPGEHLDALREQVLTSRNLPATPLVLWVFGGLGAQIEHHLFPKLPRSNLLAVSRIVRAYCAEIDVPYHQTSVWEAYRDVLSYLHEVSAPLRHVRHEATNVVLDRADH